MIRWILCSLLLLTACVTDYSCIEPEIYYSPPERYIKNLPSPFTPLSAEEKATPWGAELAIAETFGKEVDLYRAISTYKRALVLLPPDKETRIFQAHYGIAMAYYLGEKFSQAIQTIQNSPLWYTSTDFPGHTTLLLILEDSFRRCGEIDAADCILPLIEKADPELAQDLQLSTALFNACDPEPWLIDHPHEQVIHQLLDCYASESLDPSLARALNAGLPGAGYWYVGQHNSAITSFSLNTLFILAAISFFNEGHTAAGIITLGFEAGWYFGGINGAGLAAQEWNKNRYECFAKEAMLQGRLFPVLRLSYGF